MITRIVQQTLIWSLIVFVLIWGYIPSLWNMDWPAFAMLALAATSLVVWAILGLASLRKFFAKRSSQFGMSLLISATGTLAILVVVNYVANLYNKKRDITASQLYSLSNQSKKLASELKENLEIEVWSTNVQRMAPNQDLQKFLENYRIESHGKIKISVRNPNEDLNVKQRNITKDNVILVRASSGREARIENVNQEKIEEQVTNAIVEAIKGVKKTICFTKDHGELNLEDAEKMGMSQLKQTLQASSYQTQAISTTNITEIPHTCEALVIAGPKSEPTDSSIAVIQKYIANNGKAMIMLGAMAPQKWNTIIKPYGVELRNDIIIDVRVQPPTAVATQNFNRTVDIVKSFDRMVIMFQSSSISVPTSGKSGNFDIKTFVSSEPHTFAKKKTANGAIRVAPEPSDLRGPLAMAVLIEDPAANQNKGGKDGNSIPGIDTNSHEEDSHKHGHLWNPLQWIESNQAWAELPAQKPTVPVVEKTQPSNSKLIVIGNDLFASNAFVHQLGNLDLFMNSIAYMLEDKDVIGIRPRELKATRLQLSSETDRKVQATVYLLAGFCFLGAMAAASRRRKMSV